jgi:uncharacterized protein YndB with AHSA1/START domain
MNLTQAPVARAEMLIRRPASEVFNAFVDPEVTTKFWFTRGSEKLEAGKSVQWDWEMYNVSARINVKAIEPHRRILIEWSESSTTVEWLFSAHGENATFVSITHSGFSGNGDAMVRAAIGSTEGFTLVLAGLKALLEHGIQLKLVGDRFPPDASVGDQ